MKLEASMRLKAASDEDVTPTTAIAYERKQQSGKWTRRHVVVPSKDAATKLKSLKADPKVRNPKVVSASTTLECGCLSAKVLKAELTEKQKKLDINKDGKIDADDLKKVREGEKPETAATEEELLLLGAPKQADAYDWFTFTGTKVSFTSKKGQTEVLKKGDQFGVRLSSNKRFIRLVFGRLGPTKVFTIYIDAAKYLAKRSKPFDLKTRK